MHSRAPRLVPFPELVCVHVCRPGTWEQHGHQKEVVLHLRKGKDTMILQ